MGNPKFSIIIPSFNGADRIHEALSSCVEQTYKDFEIIVVCDSCTDNTEETAKSYGARTLNVNVRRDGLARNAGLDIARGDYILFLDDDDWWLHEFVFQQLHDYTVIYPKADVIFFDIIWHGQKYCKQNASHFEKMVAGHCIKRSFIGNTRFCGLKYSADIYFFGDLMKKEHHFVFTEKPMYFYNYMRPGSISDLNCRGEL